MHSANARKKFISALSLLPLLLALSLPALADMGEAVGNFTQDPTASSRQDNVMTTQNEEEKLITLSDASLYGQDSQLFYHTVEKSRFGISVPDGAVVTGTVTVRLAPSLTSTLYKNGREQTDVDLERITAAGKYVLAVTENDASQTVRVSFTILSSPTGSITEYKLPTDFYVSSATLNGESASYSQTYVDMSADGEYVIDYCSPKLNKIMQLSVTIDHTAPTLTLSGIVDGKANGPVTVSDVEEGASVYVVRNGKQTAYTGTISETGAYTLTVRDAAGNETVYDFVVVTYANSSLKALIATVAVLIATLVGYVLYYRKYIRVS